MRKIYDNMITATVIPPSKRIMLSPFPELIFNVAC